MITRRLALFRIGASSAVATVAAAPLLTTKPVAAVESRSHFETPAEYLAAMQAIGWKAVAMYRALPTGDVLRMGVKEIGGSERRITETWRAHHAIQMRVPIQRAAELPQGDWWRAVWQYLYDKGLREDVARSDAPGGEGQA